MDTTAWTFRLCDDGPPYGPPYLATTDNVSRHGRQDSPGYFPLDANALSRVRSLRVVDHVIRTFRPPSVPCGRDVVAPSLGNRKVVDAASTHRWPVRRCGCVYSSLPCRSERPRVIEGSSTDCRSIIYASFGRLATGRLRGHHQDVNGRTKPGAKAEGEIKTWIYE